MKECVSGSPAKASPMEVAFWLWRSGSLKIEMGMSQWIE
jgi:hypothetical protein